MNEPSCVATGLEHWARTDPGRIAMADEELSLTYTEFDGRVGTLARLILEHLADRGGQPTMVLPIVGGRGVRSVIAIQAAIRAGLAFATLDASSPPAVIAELFERLGGPTLAIVARPHFAGLLPPDVRWLDALHEIEHPVPPQPNATREQAAVVFTSGSTGRAKGVVYGSDMLTFIHEQRTLHAKQDGARRLLHFSPFSFVAGLSSALSPSAGLPVTLIDPSGMDPQTLLERIDREEVSRLGMVTSLAASLLGRWPSGRRLERVKRLNLFGEPLAWQQVALLRELLNEEALISGGYAATEAAMAVLAYEIPPDHPIGTGRVPLGSESSPGRVRLEPVHDSPDAPRQIVIRGVVATGYLGEPALTAQRFGVDPDGTRWWRSGDVAEQGPDGLFRHVGRLDDLIKINGKLVEPAEPERVLRQIDGIRNVIVLPHNTSTGMARLVAHLDLDANTDITPAQVRSRLADSLPPHLVPALLVRHAELPMNDRSKIDRTALQNGPTQPWRSTPPRPPGDALEQLVVDNVADLLELDTVGADDEFWDIGLDSLGAVELASRLSDAGWDALDVSAIVECPSAARLAALLATTTLQRASTITTLNATGTLKPLFCLPGRGGNALEFRSLARAFGLDQPIVVIESHGLHRPGRPDRSVPAAARRAVAEIERLQPSGRVVVAGYSAGGVVAYEIAQQLRQLGRHVQVALLDAPVAGGRREAPPDVPISTIDTYRSKIKSRSIAANARAALDKATLQVRINYRTVVPGKPSTSPARRIAFGRIAKRSVEKYSPTAAEFAVTMFAVEGSRYEAHWSRIVTHLQIVRVEGTHYTMLEPPHVQSLVQEFAPILDVTALDRCDDCGVRSADQR